MKSICVLSVTSVYYHCGSISWAAFPNFAPKSTLKGELKLFLTVNGILDRIPGRTSKAEPEATSTITGKNKLPAERSMSNRGDSPSSMVPGRWKYVN